MFDCLNCSYGDALPTDDSSTQVVSNQSPNKIAEHAVTHRQMITDDPMVHDLRQERNALLMELKHSKRQIKMLKTEQKMNRNDIEAMRAERRQVQNALDGKQVENRDVLDSVFDW